LNGKDHHVSINEQNRGRKQQRQHPVRTGMIDKDGKELLAVLRGKSMQGKGRLVDGTRLDRHLIAPHKCCDQPAARAERLESREAVLGHDVHQVVSEEIY
jgi:hypothetical protein